MSQCKNGHNSGRNKRGDCIECKKIAASKSYFKNKEKISKKRKSYYLKNKDVFVRYSVDWNRKNKEKRAASVKRYVEKNIEKIKKYAEKNREKILARKSAYNKRNKDSLNEKARHYKKENKYKINAINASRRARVRGAEGKFRRYDVDALLIHQNGKCAACYEVMTDYHIDHIVPVSAGGSNYPENLQLLCPPCNLSKGAKKMSDWIGEKGGYL